MLESVAHADLRHDSLARMDWHPECEAAVNEQIKCASMLLHKKIHRHSHVIVLRVCLIWYTCKYKGLHTHTCSVLTVWS